VNVLFFAANIALGILIPLAVQLLDRRRMTPEQRRWVWGYATWGSALYNFGPLSLVAWGYVTRSPRYARGLAVGVGLTAIALAAQALACEVLGRAIQLRPKALAESREGFVAALAVAVALALLIGAGRAVHEAFRRRPAAPGRPLSSAYAPPRR
jgi:hypothetical protein